MAKQIEIKVPDIGGAAQVDVIEILVQVGEQIKLDTPLITLESDKASMEIPSPLEGKVSKLLVKVGDKVAEGDMILMAEVESAIEPQQQESESKDASKVEQELPNTAEPVKAQAKTSSSVEVVIPDIGGATDAEVIDILVKEGSSVTKDQSLITLEGEKATMDIPSPFEGIVKTIQIKMGQKVGQGTAILIMDTQDSAPAVEAATAPGSNVSTAQIEKQEPSTKLVSPVAMSTEASDATGSLLFAGPAVRRMARELGVNLSLVQGSGRKTRITKEDVQAYVKAKLSGKATGSGFSLPQSPEIDFTKFGEIDTKPLNKIKKMTGVNVHRSWITIPHVTQFDEADITDLEEFRKAESETTKAGGYKLTLLAFVCSVVSNALKMYPQFNASLDASGENLIYKKYFNIGIAVETPNGLVVPVIKNVNQLSVSEIAIEMARLSTKARDKGLMPTDMSGGCFTISSLGGIGGTAFTPIVNGPEVAILGLSRSMVKPVYINKTFEPRLMLPLSLSYDHRVIDGAEAARFTRYIADALGDIRKILL